MEVKNIIISIIGLVTAFVSGDYLDSIEPNTHTHTIVEDCEVTREITKQK